MIEKDKIGGTCLNRGCIPTKAIIACINLFNKINKADNFGITTSNASIDLGKVMDRKNKIVEKLTKGVEFLLKKNNVEVIYGEGTMLEPGKLEVIKKDSSKTSTSPSVPRTSGSRDSVESLLVESSKLILATGSSPINLPGITFDGKQFLSSDDILDCRQIPAKLDIVGGGVIGIHFAHIFSTLGTEVTVYEALPEILSGIDEETVSLVKRILKRKKVNILTGTKFEASRSCGKTLVCVGRKPKLPGFTVNEKMETNLPNVYAIGDLISKKQLAHVAYEQGVIAAENAMGANKTFDYNCVPIGIYTDPEIGSVGLTEKEAREKYGEIKVGKFPFAALGIANAMDENEGFIKILSDKDNNILGVHIIGPEATSRIGSATIAIKNKLKVDQLADTFQSHPSYPEGLQEAALNAIKRSLHTLNQ